MQDFITAIADEHVYLFDGAMGTMLYSKGVFINKCYDELNLLSPEIVIEVHKQYARTDAEFIESTPYGDTPLVIAQRLDRAGADVIGLNCSVGPDVMLDAIEEITAVTAKKISCQPNAGLPREVNGRQMYMASPEYMAKYAKRLIHKGVKFIGGCCGTTPDHIKMIADAVRPLSPRRNFVIIERETNGKKSAGVEPLPMATRSNWGRKLAAGEFVTTIEITPPKGPNPEAMIKSVQTIKDAGVDAVNVPDGPRAQHRMGAIAVAVLLQQRVGIETVLHYCCRDRNLLGMHSDLLGCAALGLRHMLLITGDPPKMGPYPDATAVFDIDAIGLTNMVSLMNRGLDLGGNPFGEATKFTIGVGVNPGHLDLDTELRRLDWKMKAGAEYAITQPVFDARQLEHFLKR